MAKTALKELIDQISLLPSSSKEYKTILTKIQKAIQPRYGTSYILSADAYALQHELSKSATKNPGYHENQLGIYNHSLNILNPKSLTDSNEMNQYRLRYKIEHDVRYKQIMVYGIIVWGNHVITLRNPDEQLMAIGGHVDFSLHAYKTNDSILYAYKMPDPNLYTTDNILHNMKKEFDEEIEVIYNGETLTSEDFIFKYEGIVNKNDSYYNLRNVGAVYHIHCKRKDIKLEDIIWGDNIKVIAKEPLKHMVSINNLLAPAAEELRYHGYTREIIEHYRQKMSK